MAYQTGFAANECELHEIIHAFLIDNGWRLQAELGPFDRVYFSSGEDGYKDIFIRTRAQLCEPFKGSFNVGGRQLDLKDGYSGYLNFFAYQYFPEDGDGYDGYGEAGCFGPRFYWFRGNSGSGGDDVYYQQAFSQSSSNRKWKFVGDHVDDLPRDKTSPLSGGQGCFDGNSHFYSEATTFTRFNKFDIHNDTCVHISESGPNDQQRPSNLAWVMDTQTRKEYMYFVHEGRSGGGHGSGMGVDAIAGDMIRIDLDTGMLQMGFNGPSQVWDLDGTDNYKFESSFLIWDGGNYLYCARNNSTTNARKEVAKYDIATNQWSRLPDYPVNPAVLSPFFFVNKVISGAPNNRLYAALPSTVYYLNLDESGNAVGSWTSAGALPTSWSTRSSLFTTNGTNRFYYLPAGGSSNLYWAKIVDGALTWNLETSYFPATVLDEGDFWYVDGYAARVGTSIHANTKYWLVGSKDHLIVVTRYIPYGQNTYMVPEAGLGSTTVDLINFVFKYDYCYMGAFDPYASTSTNAISTASVGPGSSILIPIQLFKGEFEVGQKMYISDIVAGSTLERENLVEGSAKRFLPTEQFIISAVDPGVSITADSLNNFYPAGSRIAPDPQPVCITFNGMDRAQTLNHIDTVNTEGSTDMAENIVKLESASDEIVNASGNDGRRGAFNLWPISLVNEGLEAPFSGTEVRGKLIGIFAISSSGTANEDTIRIGQNAYVIFDFKTNKSYSFAVGPIVVPEVEE